MHPEASCTARGIDLPSHNVLDAAPVAPRPLLDWRVPATALLLIVTMPVFAVAALASLPVALVLLVARAAWRVLRLLPRSAAQPVATTHPR